LIDFFKQEINGLYRFLKRNFNEVVVLCSAALFLSLDNYHQIWSSWFSSLLYFAVLPVLVIILLLRRNPLDYGLRLGNTKVWGKYVGIFCLIAAPVLFFTSFSSGFQEYYLIENFNLLLYFSTTFISLFASEFFFRGFLIFGLKEKFKEASILIQMIPFVLVHFGKPELETVSTIITGILFGYIVYRGNSFWPAFIIHMFINIFFVALVNYLS
jgi:membrane protease YdiL (CAAX protease family)